jgi:hypothetical protein
MKNTDFLSGPNEDDPQIRKGGSTDTSDKGSSREGQRGQNFGLNDQSGEHYDDEDDNSRDGIFDEDDQIRDNVSEESGLSELSNEENYF